MSWLNLIVLLVCAAAASPAVVAVIRQLHAGKPKDRFYEDADGRSTPEAVARHSSRGPKIVILLSAVVGAGTAIATVAVSSVRLPGDDGVSEQSLLVAAWALAVIHGICIAVHHSPVTSYRLGLWLLLSAILLLASPIVTLVSVLKETQTYDDPTAILCIIQLAAALTLVVSSAALPRRPEVSINGRPVDRQRSVSALSRFTWEWIQPLLQLASVNQDLTLDDVPRGDHTLRAADLQKEWDASKPRATLLRSLSWAYKGRMGLLWSVTLVRGLISVLPFWAMLRIISILENEGREGIHRFELPALVVIMALSNLLDGWMEGWAYWYSTADIALPMRAQLASLVFGKSLRRKDICTPEKQKQEEGASSDEDPSDLESSSSSGQFVANLVGVDTERIEHFCQYSFLLLNGLVKLAIFSAFLVRLIGWLPFGAGLLAWAATLPVNAWFSGKLYAQATALMRLRDDKLARVGEALRGIRQIRFAALEGRWERTIGAARERELGALWRFFLLDTGLFACWVVSPILLAATSLTVYVIMNGRLMPSVAFVSIGMFNTLETTLGSLPELVTLGLESAVSVKRIDKYLREPEVSPNPTSDSSSVEFENATISWPSDGFTLTEDRFALHDLNISFPQGEISVISGKTGTGKSLLISAILGEADVLEGSVTMPKVTESNDHTWIAPGSVAYVSQNPWLVNSTLRENVLFGLPLVQPRYNQVIEACALEHDLASLPGGDETEIGTNGANLSGGQQWRVTLARAVYSRAEILVMEDIFSAVDTHVGRYIFEQCLTGDICRGRTRILVTHSLGLVLPKTSYMVELGDEGTVTQAGSVSLAALAQGSLGAGVNDGEVLHEALKKNKTKSNSSLNGQPPSESSLSTTRRKFMQEETREKGTVKAQVYLEYIKSCGGIILWTICGLSFLAYEVGIVGRAWWLRTWTSSTEPTNVQGLNVFHAEDAQWLYTSSPFTTKAHRLSYVDVYIMISAATAIMGTVRFFFGYVLAIRASKSIFNRMLSVILRAPLQWLDTVPTGRIINRLTADFNIIDERLTTNWTLFTSHILRVIGICAASFLVSPYLIPPALVFLAIGTVTGRRYLVASRPLKRLESNAKSPVFDLFSTTLDGISSIRAFKRASDYLSQMHEHIDTWAMTSFYIALAARWMSFRMALVAALFCVSVGIFIIQDPGVDAALAGFALSFILDFSESIRWAIRCYGEMELAMNAMERATEYMGLETERLTGDEPPAAWPTEGSIYIHDLKVSYAPDLPPVLQGLSLAVKHGERIGVVGRTGAGKSSLTLALFGFLQPQAGGIHIDGIDVSKVKLEALRSRLSIIPQDPVLFSGTIRSNLDPFGEHTDAELLSSLARVQLIDPNSVVPGNNTNIFQNLSSPVSESGGNLSQGQRQLLCIARAIVTQRKIIVLDEATSAVDVATDHLIQRSIRDGFQDSTLVVIAHRLSTIADFDKILVLDSGRVAEFGTPRELWDSNGVFRSMCESSGEKEKEKLRQSIIV